MVLMCLQGREEARVAGAECRGWDGGGETEPEGPHKQLEGCWGALECLSSKVM